MLRILKSIEAKDTEENTIKESEKKPDQHLEDSPQEDPGAYLSEEEKEQKMAQYKLWLSWIGQRQEVWIRLN